MTSQTQATILVVDDTPENIDILVDLLRPEYQVLAALNGEQAIDVMAAPNKPDLILLDVMMPGMDGYEVCLKLKADPLTASVPVIFVTALSAAEDEKKGLEIGGVDYVSKPFSPAIVLQRIRTQLALYDKQLLLESLVRQRTDELHQSRLEIIRRLGRAAEFKDNQTGMHVMRMSYYAQLLAEAYGMDQATSELVLNAAPMHDIGKIGIPDCILTKPGPLTESEWQIMQTHSHIGADIIGNHPSPVLQMARTVAITHHESWDGSGYPNGLSKQLIPVEGRMVTIADVFDALTSKRPYKEAWPIDKATDYLQENAGKKFDPELIPLFIEIMPQVLEVKQRYPEPSIET